MPAGNGDALRDGLRAVRRRNEARPAIPAKAAPGASRPTPRPTHLPVVALPIER